MTHQSMHFRFFAWGCVLAVLLCLNACVRTIPSSGLPDPEIEWILLPELPEDVRNSLRGSSELRLNREDGTFVPVRLFGTDGRRTPVVMIHGLQSHSGWFSQSAAFIGRLGHPVYAFDRRGSGLSLARRGDTKDFMEWNEDVRAVATWAMKQHGHPQVYVLGHCFGAIPAIVYAETHPRTVKGLILTTPGLYTHTSIPLSQMLKIATSLSGHRDYYFPVPLDPGQFSELPEYEPFIAMDPLALRAVTGDLYWQVHLARKFAKSNTATLTMPVLVGFAGEDEIADNRKNREWLSTVPASLKVQIVYPDARHILEYSLERESYFEDLSHWLNWLEGR